MKGRLNPNLKIIKPSFRVGKAHLKIVGGTLLIGLIIYVIVIQHFLAVTSPVRAEILVVEGWIWDKPAMREVLEEFNKGGYQRLICVGEPLRGRRVSDRKSYADLAASRLVELGIEERFIHRLTVSNGEDHRTYSSAFAVRDWVRKEKPAATAVNVFTLGVHARKSQVLFKKAFGPKFEIGIIAGTESAYPVHTWWASRTGIYLVLRNTVGYLYALICPPPESQTHQ